MRHIHFIAIALFMFRLAEATSLAKEDPQSTYDYAKVISPLTFEHVVLDDLFVFEGTFSIKYQFDIGELLAPIDLAISQLLTPEVCNRSEMVKYFCVRLGQGGREMQKEVQPALVKMKALSSKSNVTGLKITHMSDPSFVMEMNGTSDSVESIKREEERFNKLIAESTKSALTEITKKGNGIQKPGVMSMFSGTLQKLWPQQRNRVALLQDTLSKCRVNHLPSRFINLTALQNDLKEVERQLNETSFVFAVPMDKIANLAVADCAVRNGTLQVTVNVPVRQSGNWTVQTVKPIPFMFKGEKCKIFPDERMNETWVVGEHDRQEIIRELDYQKIEGGLFIARESESDALQKQSCLFAVLNNHSSSELKQVCPFSCTSNNSSVSIVPLGGSIYVVSGANHMNMSCAAGEKSISFPDYGSMEVNIDICKCQIMLSGKNGTHQLESSRRSCDPQKKGFPETTHVIPSQWTLSSTVQRDHRQPLTSLNQVFDRNWRQVSGKENNEREIVDVQRQIPANEPWDKWMISLLVFLVVVFLVFGTSSILWCITIAAKKTKQQYHGNARAYNLN